MTIIKSTDVLSIIDEKFQKRVWDEMDNSIMKNISSYWYADYGKKLTNYKPKQIIFQTDLKTTVVIWDDDSKTVVKCSGEEEFVPEIGFAMALVKKIFPNRSEFLRMIEGSYKQPVRNKKAKIVYVETPTTKADATEIANMILDIVKRTSSIS